MDISTLTSHSTEWAELLAVAIIQEVRQLSAADAKELIVLHLVRVKQEGRVEGLEAAIETVGGKR
jgi:hypothetical protein